MAILLRLLDRGVPELVAQEVERHAGPREMHRCGVSVIVQAVPGDAGELAGPAVFLVDGMVRDGEDPVRPGQPSLLDLRRHSFSYPPR